MIFVNSSNQTLYLFKEDNLIFESKVSTSKYGMGCKMNSYKTPTGLHSVSSMIGKGLPAGTLFRNRKPTEEDLSTALFTWKVLRHAKSNGILISKNNTTVGLGAGQVSLSLIHI